MLVHCTGQCEGLYSMNGQRIQILTLFFYINCRRGDDRGNPKHTEMAIKNNITFGHSIERLVESMLLREDRDVYIPSSDDHGIDMIVATKCTGCTEDNCSDCDASGNKPASRFQEIQIKSVRTGGLFAAIKCPNPRPEYWFVFYVEQHNTFWLVNSMDFVQIASRNVKGKNIGKYSLLLASPKGIRAAMAQYIVTDFSKLP